jgi:hypothetical protein
MSATNSPASRVANQPAQQATFLEQTAAGVLRGSVVGDGDIPPSQHAKYAVRLAWALCHELSVAAPGGDA